MIEVLDAGAQIGQVGLARSNGTHMHSHSHGLLFSLFLNLCLLDSFLMFDSFRAPSTTIALSLRSTTFVSPLGPSRNIGLAEEAMES